MAGFTKWITGGLGFVLGGPIGALIGFFVGSLIDGGSQTQLQESQSPSGRNDSTAEGDFKISLLVLIASVMKADGRPNKAELNVVKQFLVSNFGEEGALEALQMLKNLLQQDINDVEVVIQINRYMNYSSKLQLIHFLFEIAYADGIEHVNEIHTIQRIATNMRITPLDFESLRAPYRKTKDTNWAYKTLEIEPVATNDEIKKAYREMAKKYHPDTVANLGEDIKKKATEKFRTINEAYEELKKQRGMM